MRRLVSWSLLLLVSVTLYSQKIYQPNSAEIYAEMNKLNVLGTALYIAAHPDDENQRLISYLANEKGYYTTYLSMTRGDGGQNILGTEIKEQLGVIRTQELLQARSIDGGHQRFSRAIDFGYSKHPDETFAIWNKGDVLADVVYTIRELQPDVIINRFDHRTPGSTHGHHTGSAVLSIEAFGICGDPTMYPDQLKIVQPWQPSTIYMNTSPWFYGGQEAFDKVDKTDLYAVDIGVYYPLLGQSNSEISQAARSMHKCQGFGATGYRGSTDEWLEYIDGDQPVSKLDVFGGINTSWSRVKGGEIIQPVIDQLLNTYSFDNPSASIPLLIKAYSLIEQLSDPLWKSRKQEDIKNIIASCMGLYLETKINTYSAVPGDSILLSFEAINRSDISARLIDIESLNATEIIQSDLKNNVRLDDEINWLIPSSLQYSSPFWLTKPHGLGSYDVSDLQLRNKPEVRDLIAIFKVEIEGRVFHYERPLVYKWNDPVDGERYRTFELTPPVSVAISDDVYLVKVGETKDVNVKIQALKNNFEGIVKLNAPEGWDIEPTSQRININQKGDERTLTFKVAQHGSAPSGSLQATVEHKLSSTSYDRQVQVIDYHHIPTQTMQAPATAVIKVLDIKKKGDRIGYIMGAGDEVPEALGVIGYEVDLVDPSAINVEMLKRYDAVVVGIRAFNRIEALKFKNQVLFDYTHQGGTVVVQYNTRHRLKTKDIAPYSIQLSRDRVTDEYADVRFLQPKHAILNIPNKISQEDFKGWVQERGLYFPDEWSDDWTPILGMNDDGEESLEGGLLVAKYGNGYYIHTSLSFWREVPAGVTGAYRLLANLVSIGK